MMEVVRPVVAGLLLLVLGAPYAQTPWCAWAEHDGEAMQAMSEVMVSDAPAPHHAEPGCHELPICGFTVIAAVSDGRPDTLILPTHVEEQVAVRQQMSQQTVCSLTPPPKL